MNQVMAFLPGPLKTVFRVFRARNFNYQPDGAGRVALRRMAHVFREQENLAFFNWYLDWWLARLFHNANKNVPFELVEKFFGGIVVIIHSLVGSSDDSDNDVAIFPNLSVTDGRF